MSAKNEPSEAHRYRLGKALAGSWLRRAATLQPANQGKWTGAAGGPGFATVSLDMAALVKSAGLNST